MLSLNVGCGPFYADGWVNVDRYAEPGRRPPDMVASASELPFPSGYFGRAYLGHVLEHVAWESVPGVLREVRRVVAAGGPVMIVGPCLERALKTSQPQNVLDGIVASPGVHAPGVDHEWSPTELLTVLAARSVFPDAEPVPLESLQGSGWPVTSFAPWQCAVRAA